MAAKIRSTKRNVLWTVQVKVEKKQGKGEWRTVVDNFGPMILQTRSSARGIANSLRSNSKRNFRIAKVTVP